METDIDARKIALHPYLGKYSGQAGRPGPQARLKLFQVTNIVVRGYDDTAPLKKVVVAGTCASFPSVRAWFTTCARDRPTFSESLHAQTLFLERICISHREQPLRFLNTVLL